MHAEIGATLQLPCALGRTQGGILSVMTRKAGRFGKCQPSQASFQVPRTASAESLTMSDGKRISALPGAQPHSSNRRPRSVTRRVHPASVLCRCEMSTSVRPA